MWYKYIMLYYEKWCMLFSTGKCKCDTLSLYLNNVWICSWADIHIIYTTFFGSPYSIYLSRRDKF